MDDRCPPALRPADGRGRLAFEGGLVVLGGCAAVVGALGATRLPVQRDQMQDLLALAVVGVGAAAVGLGQTAGRLAGNRRAAWLIPALAVYCAVIVPEPMLVPDVVQSAIMKRPGTLVACGVVVALLLAAVRPPTRAGSRAGWLWAAGGSLVAVALNVTAAAYPLVVPAAAPPIAFAVTALWCSVSIAVVVAGYRARSAPLWRVGLGFGVIAGAHLYRAAVPTDLPGPSLEFAALRLMGVGVVLLAMAQLLRRALTTVCEERFAHQEDLRLAGLRAAELVRSAAERDHELRNGLSGLLGISELLAGLELDERRRCTGSAVIHELERLRLLVGGGGAAPATAPAVPSRHGLYDAGQVVREIVELWRVAGLHIDAVIPSEVVVIGRPTVLAQVLANLLKNCSRHAPGSDVRVVVEHRGPVVSVRISDDGPRYPVAADRPGMVDGEGIGLRICRRLLADEGGHLRTTEPGPGGGGFSALVELQAVPVPGARSAADPSPGLDLLGTQGGAGP